MKVLLLVLFFINKLQHPWNELSVQYFKLYFQNMKSLLNCLIVLCLISICFACLPSKKETTKQSTGVLDNHKTTARKNESKDIQDEITSEKQPDDNNAKEIEKANTSEDRNDMHTNGEERQRIDDGNRKEEERRREMEKDDSNRKEPSKKMPGKCIGPKSTEQTNEIWIIIEQQRRTRPKPEQANGTRTETEQANGMKITIEQQNGAKITIEQQNGAKITIEQQNRTKITIEQQNGTKITIERKNGTGIKIGQQKEKLMNIEEWNGINTLTQRRKWKKAIVELKKVTPKIAK